MSQGIKSKVVVIIGASSGIGAASARYLAARGAVVSLAARRKDKLDVLVGEIVKAGGKAQAYGCDVTKKEQVKAVVDATVKEHGKLDVIINNAGIMPIRPIQECNTEEWDAMVDINIKGVLYGIAAALPVFVKQNSGQFINMSSIAGVKVFAPGGTVYSGTKFAVRAISDGLRLEVGPKIRVCSIEPGSVDSELKYNTTGTAQKMVLDLYEKTALPVETIARAIAYAIEQSADVDINEIVIRPTAQEF